MNMWCFTILTKSRKSRADRAISDFLVAFARQHQLEVVQDEVLNVIIKKPATAGYERVPTVILQGHMDMVCEKNSGVEHDFETEPLRLRIKDDMLYATDTTLGADNGIAVAYALALLASTDIPHPALEVVITSEEETTMRGALMVDPQHFRGRILINLDSEAEGKLLVSSAGGIQANHLLPVRRVAADPADAAYRLTVRGLRGGHSGASIDQGRGNANKLLGRVLHDLSIHFSYALAEVSGGQKSNAIPREADAVLLLPPEDYPDLEAKLAEWNRIVKNELRVADPHVELSITKSAQRYAEVFSEDTKLRVIAALVLVPNGVLSMSNDIAGLVESSTNLGVVTTSAAEVRLVSEVRSSLKSLKEQTVAQMKMIATVLGCECTTTAEYPEWPYNPDSRIRPLFVKVYREKYGSEPEVIAIHAGLECGIFGEKLPGLDMVSIGPDMYDVHTPDEHLSISSAIRTWDYLLEVLAAMGEEDWTGE